MRLNIALFLLMSWCMAGSSAALAGEDTYTPIQVQIEMDRSVFHLGEELDGYVILSHHHPGNLPQVFQVRLYQQDGRSIEFLTSVPRIRMGRTKIALKKFGIPLFREEKDAGFWKMMIYPQHQKSRIDSVVFELVP